MDSNKNNKSFPNKQTEFFNYGFTLLLRTFNWLLIFYITFSFTVYLFYYFLHEDILQKKWFDEKFILKNSYFSCIISIQVLLSLLSLSKRSATIYSLYLAYSVAMTWIIGFKHNSNLHTA